MRKASIAMALTLVALAMAALLAGCGPGAIERSESGTAQPPATASSPTPLPTGTISLPITPDPPKEEQPVSIPAQAQDAVAWAQADVARQLGIQTSSVAVLEVESVAWRDSSLGCSQPGMVYLQVITPGYRILLQSGDGVYEYHSSSGAGRAILCTRGVASDRRPLPTKPPSDAKQ